ncbi:hypothetical protein Poli38472_005544 [Pythium oligandrum]|uniref:Uncharacterized protein n=1 Tax=Pythium oligandrum TaxID=41045 RepID=A0A8K1FHN4_PYTOL|nr:hypothetical protein Poli38472_005544 [Pythium oligandrum]|eukprot:TMW62926.1 hypothetical protein Poli38472_005544 [Pythium oligandrum]
MSKKKKASGHANATSKGNTSNVSKGDSGGSSARGAAAALSASKAPYSTHKSLETATQYYMQLTADGNNAKARLDGVLWLHHSIAVVVINALLFDGHVDTQQQLIVGATVFWLGRRFLLQHIAGYSVLRRGWQRVSMARTVLLFVFAGVMLPLAFDRFDLWSTQTTQLLGVIIAFDVMSVAVLIGATSDTEELSNYALDGLETVFLVGLFSTQFSHRPHLIYDRYAFRLSCASVATHCMVIAGAKSAVFARSVTDDKRSHQRRDQLLAQARASLAYDGFGDQKTSENEEEKTSKADQFTPSWLEWLGDSRGKLLCWTSMQTLLVLTQVTLSWFVLYSWELSSVLMLSSSHVLWELLRLEDLIDKPFAPIENPAA